MFTTPPSSDRWDWPTTRTGQAAMASLGGAFAILFITPLVLWIAPIGDDEESLIAWIAVPVLTAGALALRSGVLALATIIVKRGQSIYL